MTLEELAAIEARANAATDGPWKSWCYNENNPSYAVDAPRGASVASQVNREANGVFIAYCKQDIPALLAEVRRLQRLVSKETTQAAAVPLLVRQLDRERVAVDALLVALEEADRDWAGVVTAVAAIRASREPAL